MRPFGNPAGRFLPLDRVPDGTCHDVDVRDEIEALLSRFRPRSRAWLEAYLETGDWYLAAERLGLARKAVRYAQRRIRPTLEALAARRAN